MILSEFFRAEDMKDQPMDGLKIPSIDPLRLLLFKNLKINSRKGAKPSKEEANEIIWC